MSWHMFCGLSVSVCLLVTTISPARTAEQVEMSVGRLAWANEPCVRWGVHWRHLANAIAWIDAALCQASSTTCYGLGIPLITLKKSQGTEGRWLSPWSATISQWLGYYGLHWWQQPVFVSRITRAVKGGGIFMTFGEWVDCVMERSRVYCGRLRMFRVRNSTLLLASNDILWQRYALCWVSSSIQCFTRVFLCHCCWYAIMMPPQFIQLAITSISVFILMPFLELLCIFTKTAHQNFSSSIFHQQHCLKDCT